MTAAVLLGFWESAVKTAGKVISLKKTCERQASRPCIPIKIMTNVRKTY